MALPAIVWVAALVGGASLLGRKEQPKPDKLTGDRSDRTPNLEQQLNVTRQQRRPEDRGPGNTGSAWKTNILPHIRGFELRRKPTRQRPDYQRIPEVRFTDGIPRRKSRIHPAVERNVLTTRRHTLPLLITDTGVSTERSEPGDIMPDDLNKTVQRMEE